MRYVVIPLTVWCTVVAAGARAAEPPNVVLAYSCNISLPPSLFTASPAVLPAGRDSLSFVPALRGRAAEQQQHEFLYWEFHERGISQATLYQGRWKGIRERTLEAPLALYDLQNDIAEKTDVATKQPEIVAKLNAYLKTARSDSPDWPIKAAPGKKPSP